MKRNRPQKVEQPMATTGHTYMHVHNLINKPELADISTTEYKELQLTNGERDSGKGTHTSIISTGSHGEAESVPTF